MKTALSIFVGLLWLALAAPAGLGQDKPSSQSETAATEENYHLVFFLPTYRFVTTSGFAGRVAEYDSLNQAVGGELALTFLDSRRRYSWKSRAEFLSRDEYDTDAQLRLGSYFTLGINARGFIRHLDNVPFGTNLSPDDISRTDTIPESLLFGFKRTTNVVNARLKMPGTPLTFFVRGGWGAKRGVTQLQYFDMGASQESGVCDTCHQTSGFRSVNYTTRSIGAGVELKVNHAVVTYEHTYRSYHDRLQNPFDLYGSALSVEEEPLGAPDTPAGNLVHNVLPSHRTQSDILRARVPLPHALAFNGSISYARTRNRFTDYPQNLLNADATLNWNPRRILRTTVDFHQQNLLNDFTPDFPLFGNLSLHRYWVGARVDSTATSFLDLEAHYRRTNVTRSNAFLWPQEYSPGTIGLVGTIADAFVTRVIPATFSNTAGVSAKLHHGERCSLRTGYEWVGTHAPGYLTDPQTAHRAFATGSLAVTDWLTFTDDFSVLLQNSFVGIQRRNRLWLNTAYLTVKPLWQRADWTLSLGYGYYQNNLQTDLMYGVDPFYPESFVPFKALSQSYSVSSAYLLKKKLAWNLDFSTVSSRSDFRPNLTSPLIPLCGTVPCSDSVVVAQAISLINVPQIGVGSTLDYRWGRGMNSGVRFQYAGYSDRVPRDSSGQLVRPNLTGHFRSFTLFVGRTW